MSTKRSASVTENLLDLDPQHLVLDLTLLFGSFIECYLVDMRLGFIHIKEGKNFWLGDSIRFKRMYKLYRILEVRCFFNQLCHTACGWSVNPHVISPTHCSMMTFSLSSNLQIKLPAVLISSCLGHHCFPLLFVFSLPVGSSEPHAYTNLKISGLWSQGHLW